MQLQKLSKKIDVKKLAADTDGASGAELKSICTEAGMLAIRDGRDTVSPDDFKNAIKKVFESHRPKTGNAPGVLYL